MAYNTAGKRCYLFIHFVFLQKRLTDKKAAKTTLINKIDVKKNRSVVLMILCCV